jgi:hypothetical protein
VKFGTVVGTNVNVVSGTQLTVVAPAQAAQTHDVYVTTPGGTSAQSSADEYAYS